MEELDPWDVGKKGALPGCLSGVAWRDELEGQNRLLLLLYVWNRKVSTAVVAHTFLIISCLTGPSLLTQPLPSIYLCLKKRLSPSIFSLFSSSCGTGVAFSYPCWSPRALMSKTLLSASSGVISHQLLLPTPLPSFMAVSQAAAQRLLLLSLFLRVVDGY